MSDATGTPPLTNVDKYILNFATKKGISASGRSRYYQLENKVVRVSDHIGNNSDGCFHIIVKPNGYIIHHPATGTVNICNYRQVQEFIRSIALMPVDDRQMQNIIVASEDDKTVLGVPISAFSIGQLNSIVNIVKKVKGQKDET